METNSLKRIIFPRAFAIAIDDMGWNDGSNLSQNTPSGPHRAGVKRAFDLNDYKHIVNVGQAVGARIQGLFILSEMDRENVLAKYPTTTHLREKWNNLWRVNDNQIAIMKYVREQAGHLEFGFHGTGHEYWADDGIQRRAEWYNMVDRQPWPEESLRQHVQGFWEIMAQYEITPQHGHSFPESFVPCAYSYYWNPDGEYSLGKLLTEAGVKYANTDFAQIPELSPPPEVNGGAFDHGTHVINRMNFGNHWYELDSLPKVPIDMQGTDIIESHWVNWLAPDDFRQDVVTARWIAYYREMQKLPGRYIAKNTEQLHSQWLYRRFAIIHETEPGRVEIDNTQMPHEAYRDNLLGNLVLKIKLSGSHEHVTEATLNGRPIPAYFEDEGFAFLYLPSLGQEKFELTYRTGTATMPLYVYNDGTYNVYGMEDKGKEVAILLKMYGTQTVKIKCKRPEKAMTATSGLKIADEHYDTNTGMLHLQVEAWDIQGQRGEIKLLY